MAKRKPTAKPEDKTPEKYIGATVSYLNALGGVTWPPFNQRIAVQCMTGWQFAAMQINAKACASTPLRLYTRVKKGKTPTFEAKRLDRMTKRYMGAKASPFVRRKSAEWGDDVVEVQGAHPLVELLNKVNPFDDGFAFAWARFMFVQATGNAYIHPVFDPSTGMPYELWTMRPQWIEIIPDRKTYIAGYRYGANQADQDYFAPSEVIHFRAGMHPYDPFYGYGPMEAGWNVVCQAMARNLSDLAFFENNARPDFAVIAKGTNDQNALDRVTSAIEGRMKGPRKRGKMLALTGDVELKPLQFPPKDMAGAYEIVEQLAAVFGVPVTLLKANDPNLASAEVGYSSWRQGTIHPMLMQDEQVLNQKLVPMFGLADDAFLAYDNPVPEDRAFERDKAVSFVGAGIWTPNEARLLDGMDALPGGDALVTQGMPVEAAMDFDAEAPKDAEAKPTAPQAPAQGEQPANATNEGLNGAQLTSMVQILQSISAGTLAPEAARELMIAAGLEPGVAARTVAAQSRIKIETPEPAAPKQDPAKPEPADTKSVKTDDVASCVAGKVPILINEGYSRAQAVAIAYSMCGEGKTEAEAKAEYPPEEPDEDSGVIEPGEDQETDECKGECVHESGLEQWPDEVRDSRKAIESQPEDDGGDAGDDVREGEGVTPAMLMRARLRPTFAQQYQRIANRLMVVPKSIKIAKPTLEEEIRAALGPEATQEIVEATLPSIRAALAGGARWGLERIKRNPSMFDVSNPRVAQSLDAYSIRLANEVNQATVDMIAQQMQAGLEAGESVQQVAARFMDTLPQNGRLAPGARSVVIARTESARAYVAGEEVGWQESGVVRGKRWLLAPGACEFCVATAQRFNSQDNPVPLGQPFYKLGSEIVVGNRRMKIDYTAVEGAPLHPNCRCDVLPELE